MMTVGACRSWTRMVTRVVVPLWAGRSPRCSRSSNHRASCWPYQFSSLSSSHAAPLPG